jgi:hypothetical protein
MNPSLVSIAVHDGLDGLFQTPWNMGMSGTLLPELELFTGATIGFTNATGVLPAVFLKIKAITGFGFDKRNHWGDLPDRDGPFSVSIS